MAHGHRDGLEGLKCSCEGSIRVTGTDKPSAREKLCGDQGGIGKALEKGYHLGLKNVYIALMTLKTHASRNKLNHRYLV